MSKLRKKVKLFRTKEEILKIIYDKCINEDGCVVYTGAIQLNAKGNKTYPSIYYNGKTHKGHRLIYSLLKGEIGNNFVLHKCDNMQCINIEHLYLGGAKENALDMTNRKRTFAQNKTHCKNGHEFTQENTSIRKNIKNGRTFRFCIPCSIKNVENRKVNKPCEFCNKNYFGYKNQRFCTKKCSAIRRFNEGTSNLKCQQTIINELFK